MDAREFSVLDAKATKGKLDAHAIEPVTVGVVFDVGCKIAETQDDTTRCLSNKVSNDLSTAKQRATSHNNVTGTGTHWKPTDGIGTEGQWWCTESTCVVEWKTSRVRWVWEW